MAELAALLVAAPVAGGLAWWRPRPLLRTAASGREVSLAAGPATALGLLAAQVVRESRARPAGRRSATPALVAVLGAAAAGAFDDLAEARLADPAGAGRPARGFGGHLGALAAGRITTGVVKIVVVGAAGLVAALAMVPARGRDGGRRAPTGGRSPTGRWALAGRVLGDTALVAGTANVVNLFDLRPGRAAKVALLGCAVLVLSGAGAPPGVLGAVGATLAGDLRGRWMLGDTGANPLGAALGVRVAGHGGPLVRSGWLLTLLVLTVASERISFTEVIAAHRVLRAVDRLGQR